VVVRSGGSGSGGGGGDGSDYGTVRPNFP